MEKRDEIENSKEDFNFKVDFKKDKYKNNFKSISKIFEVNGNYVNFIKNIKNPIAKEIYILMRKYQNFFTKMIINEKVIFDFSNSQDCLLNQYENYLKKESENYMSIEIEILPKFKKNEINFLIPEDLLKTIFIFNFWINDNNEFSFLEISQVQFINLNNMNILDSQIYKNICKITNNLFSTFLNEYSQNFIQGLNKFITYLENYFPEIAKQASTLSKKEKKAHWTQEEQNLLEAALIKYKNEKNAKEKFQKIAEEVKTKTISECVKRFKELKEVAKYNIAEDEKEKIKEKKVQQIIEVEEDKKLSISTTKTEEGKTPFENKMPKPSSNQISKQNNRLEPYTYKFLNTNDLVDEIINQYNILYANVKFDPIYDSEDEFHGEEYLDNLSENSQDYENEEDEILDEVEDYGEQIDYNPNHKKNHSEENNIKFIKNLILLGEKSSFLLEGLIIYNIGLAEINDLNLYLKCGKCKQIAYESKFYKINKNLNLFYSGAICPKCQNHMHVAFKSDLIHQNNIKYAGSIYTMGVTVADVLSTTYTINCINCEENYKKINLRTGSIHFKNKNCDSCRRELNFTINSIKLSNTYKNDTSFLYDLKIENFVKYNMEINDYSGSNYVKLYDRVGQVGTPLKENGTCKHYAFSFRWFRFDCCGRVYPCDICHDDLADHKSEYAQNILCGFCSFEQTSQNNLCSKCGKKFTKESSNRGFWEGGKGTRTKMLMSNKDSHKFKNSGMKTVSRRKKKENHTK